MVKTKNKKLVPKLRFPEFREEWKYYKLSDISKFGSGGTPSKEESAYWGGDIPWISASSMQGHLFSESELKITESGLIKGSSLARKGDLLLLVRGSMLFNKIPVGITGRDVAFNQDVKSVTCKSETTSNFILQWFLAKQNLLLNMVVGTGIGAGKLDTQDLKRMLIHLPSHTEQKKIASFLSAVDTKIQLLTRKKELLEQYKKGVMQKIFSQQIRFKDDNGNNYPDWEEKKLGDVCEIVGGGTPETSKPEYWNGKIPWFTPTEIQSKYIAESKRTISKLGLKNSSARLLPAGTILFTSRATVAEASFAMEECTTNQGFQSIIVDTSNDAEFVYYLIKQNKKEFIRKAQGSTFLEISNNEMKKMKVLVPTLLEQKEIGLFLSQIDQRIESIQCQLIQTQTFKKGLLQQMFV